MKKFKIDFIICEDGGTWFLESVSLPGNIAAKSNDQILAHVKEDNNLWPDAIFVGVYWRDPNVDFSN